MTTLTIASAPPAPAESVQQAADRYLTTGRLTLISLWRDHPLMLPVGVIAEIADAKDPYYGRPVRVTLDENGWRCGAHPDEQACGHRLAAQQVTGYSILGGRVDA